MNEHQQPMVEQLGLFDTIEIPLTRGYTAIVDAVDSDLLNFKWSITTCKNRVYGARYVKSNGKRTFISMHRVVFERVIERVLTQGELVDHKDNNPLNNRRGNLRIATKAENNMNSKLFSANKSGVRGVFFNKASRKWQAKLTVNGKRIHLGLFVSLEEASAAYREAAIAHFGEFVRLS